MESLKRKSVLTTSVVVEFLKAHGKVLVLCLSTSVISSTVLLYVLSNNVSSSGPWSSNPTKSSTTCGQCVNSSDPVTQYPLPVSNLSAVLASLR